MDAASEPVLSRRLDELLERPGFFIEPFTTEQVTIARQVYRDYGRGSGHPARLQMWRAIAESR